MIVKEIRNILIYLAVSLCVFWVFHMFRPSVSVLPSALGVTTGWYIAHKFLFKNQNGKSDDNKSE